MLRARRAGCASSVGPGAAPAEIAFTCTSFGANTGPSAFPTKRRPAGAGLWALCGDQARSKGPRQHCKALGARQEAPWALQQQPWRPGCRAAAADACNRGGPHRSKVRGPSAPRLGLQRAQLRSCHGARYLPASCACTPPVPRIAHQQPGAGCAGRPGTIRRPLPAIPGQQHACFPLAGLSPPSGPPC